MLVTSRPGLAPFVTLRPSSARRLGLPAAQSPLRLARRAVAGDLANLLEPVALNDVEKDHGGHVVSLRVPFGRPGIGDSLVPEAPECADHIGPRREGSLGVRGSP